MDRLGDNDIQLTAPRFKKRIEFGKLIDRIRYAVKRKDIRPAAPRFKKWIEFEELVGKIRRAVERKDIDAVSSLICSYVSAAYGVDADDMWWCEVADAFIEYRTLCLPRYSFTFLSEADEKRNDPPWEYEGRTWYVGAHLLAKTYGWTLDDISELDFNDALGMIQEIMIDIQLDREWEWSLSEVAYTYDHATKTSKLVPYPRPDWMKRSVKRIEAPEVAKIPKYMMPIGYIIRMRDDNEKADHAPGN